jgi:hypothetical protein
LPALALHHTALFVKTFRLSLFQTRKLRCNIQFVRSSEEGPSIYHVDLIELAWNSTVLFLRASSEFVLVSSFYLRRTAIASEMRHLLLFFTL